MAFQTEQSASVIFDAVCSGILLPVVMNVPVEPAVYARPMGPAQLVNSTTVMSARTIFIITQIITQLAAASQDSCRQEACAVVEREFRAR